MKRLRLNGEDPKFATTDRNPKRNVEYLVYGASNPDPALPVMINLHGSGFEASFEKSIHHAEAEHFGVKGIAISWTGHGGTDIKVGRQICEWAAEDLDAVLRAESVGEFFITGHSSGNPHAMIAAWHFGARCVGLGLNAPYFDDALCKEINKKGQIVSPSLGQEKLPTQATLAKCYMGLYWAFMDIMLVRCAPTLPTLAINVNAPEDRWFKEAAAKSCVRATARGGVGPAGWETAFDTGYLWGFDPREIPSKGCKNICVWHASDDHMCEADNGKWLAEFFSQQDGVTVDFRDDDVGLGHWTYCRGDFVTDPEKCMLKTLLSMWRGEYTPSTVSNPIRNTGKESNRERNQGKEIRVQPSPSV